jgi:hypothetical protein
MKPKTALQPSSPRVGTISSVWNLVQGHQVELALFLVLWFTFGLAINSRNQFAFTLQQAGVEAIVERRQFSLEGSSTPQLQLHIYYDGEKPMSDAFIRDGRQYAAKQPGQAILGAMVYSVLRLFGLSYAQHYLLTSALVTFFTTSLALSAAALAVFAIVREITTDSFCWPIACALTYGLATTAFVYSGVSLHDPIASSFLVIAFYLLVLISHRQLSSGRAKVLALLSGVLIGLTLTTSMLPFLMACGLCLYVLSLRRWDLSMFAFCGVITGLLPLLVYDTICFGNPFLLANVAGGYSDTFWEFQLSNFVNKVRFYSWEITNYVPVVWAGLFGLAFLPREFRREQVAMSGLLVALAIQVLNIDSQGGCQYGPRYLVPAMPYACIGIAGLHFLRKRGVRIVAQSAAIGLAIASFFISAAGAIHGAMYCQTQVYALGPAITAIRQGAWRDLPLAAWLAIPWLASLLMFVYAIRRYNKPVAVALGEVLPATSA